MTSTCSSEQKSLMLTSGEDALKFVEMTTQDLVYYINLVDKSMAGFQRLDSNFERSLTEGKMLSNSTV